MSINYHLDAKGSLYMIKVCGTRVDYLVLDDREAASLRVFLNEQERVKKIHEYEKEKAASFRQALETSKDELLKELCKVVSQLAKS